MEGIIKEFQFKDGELIRKKFINGKYRTIYEKTKSGRIFWSAYSDRGNRIYSKNSGGRQFWFDENMNSISKSEFNKMWKKVSEGLYIPRLD